MVKIEINRSDYEELMEAVEKVQDIGECTDIPCLISSLMYYLPTILREDYDI